MDAQALTANMAPVGQDDSLPLRALLARFIVLFLTVLMSWYVALAAMGGGVALGPGGALASMLAAIGTLVTQQLDARHGTSGRRE
jgi:hypothetical protein